ncbi:hypothetical protein PG990_012057 [Apiospora arundinis]
MHAIQLGNDLGNDPTDQVVARLCKIFGDPVARGEAWLREHAREMWSTTSTGVLVKEQYSQLLLKEITTDWSLSTIASGTHKRWNVFLDHEPRLTTANYPDDLHTTALSLHTTVLGLYDVHPPIDPVYHTLEQMLMYIRDDGHFYTYFDKNRPRIDPIVSTNILRTFYTCWRGDQVRPTLDAMLALVQTRAYDFAMRYYMHPDWFFYYLSDLCLRHPRTDELADLRRLLRERLVERFGGGGGKCRWDNDALAASLRLIAAHNLGMECSPRDVETVTRAQQRDGSWSEEPWVFRYGSGVLLGNAGLVTACAVRGLELARANRATRWRSSSASPPRTPVIVPDIVVSSPTPDLLSSRGR